MLLFKIFVYKRKEWEWKLIGVDEIKKCYNMETRMYAEQKKQ